MKLTLFINELNGGFHMLLLSKERSGRVAEAMEEFPFAPHQLADALKQAMELMKRHRMTRIEVHDPALKLLKTVREQTIMLPALRLYLSSVQK